MILPPTTQEEFLRRQTTVNYHFFSPSTAALSLSLSLLTFRYAHRPTTYFPSFFPLFSALPIWPNLSNLIIQLQPASVCTCFCVWVWISFPFRAFHHLWSLFPDSSFDSFYNFFKVKGNLKGSVWIGWSRPRFQRRLNRRGIMLVSRFLVSVG